MKLRSNFLLTVLCSLLWAQLSAVLYADDPPPVPVDAPAVIVASKEVTGTGTKDDPFVFDTTTKCLLKFMGKADGVAWDTDDCPPGFEVIDGKYGAFDLASPGLYQTAVHGGTVYSKKWFEIKGPNGPPTPVNQLVAKLKAALVGPDAKTDASKLAGMAEATADALEAGTLKTHGELSAFWKTGQSAAQWPAGRYADMPGIIRLAIPVVDESAGPVQIDAVNRTAFVGNMRTIGKTARAIGNGQ